MDVLTALNEPLLWLLFVATFLAASEVGFRCGRRGAADQDLGLRAHMGALQASLLGLLALMLGFTLSMGMSRYETRRTLVVEESNGIATTYLRADFLGDGADRQARTLLRSYVDARLAFYDAGTDERKLTAALTSAEGLQRQLWAVAAKVGREAPTAVPVALFIQSLNDVIDTHDKRVRALEDHVPESVVILAGLVAAVAFGFIGYECGLVGRRRLPSLILVAATVATVFLVIVDLDRPRSGMIRVSQRAMLSLKKTLANESR